MVYDGATPFCQDTTRRGTYVAPTRISCPEPTSSSICRIRGTCGAGGCRTLRAFRKLSSVLCPLSSVLCPPSSVLRPPSSVLCPLSSSLQPPRGSYHCFLNAS